MGWWRFYSIIGIWLAFIAALIWGWYAMDLRWMEMIRSSGNIITYLGGYFDGSVADYMRRSDYYFRQMVITVHMAVWSTTLALIFSVPLGLLSAHNVAPWWIRHPIRRAMDSLRAINELVFALIFVSVVGLGPMAGMLALFVHTTGTLAKLFSEAVESIDPRPVEGIRATGAGRIREVSYGVVPQVMPLWISYTLYRFESNVRSATVVGIVGAGGIGQALAENIRGFDYVQTAAILGIIIITVVIIDVISAQLRHTTT
ncbi:MAG: phosphonate ABC transporter, permease protein PhnE [Planctomycetota bacterium]|nr:MAG: phosphonate ABC transporter, permease protein PhnE [Planctomycetota bacterium]